MNLTGKCREEFEKWYKLQDIKISYVKNEDGDLQHWNLEHDEEFIQLPDSMKYGVFVDFFDSVGIILDVQPVMDYNDKHYTKILYWFPIVTELLKDLDKEENELEEFKTRPEARTTAIQKANYLYNKNN